MTMRERAENLRQAWGLHEWKREILLLEFEAVRAEAIDAAADLGESMACTEAELGLARAIRALKEKV